MHVTSLICVQLHINACVSCNCMQARMHERSCTHGKARAQIYTILHAYRYIHTVTHTHFCFTNRGVKNEWAAMCMYIRIPVCRPTKNTHIVN